MTKRSTARVTWPHVLRALDRDETRSYALNLFRSSGFYAESFGHLQQARQAVAAALTATEDWAEMAHPRWDRTAIRDVRRRLELEST
jgi:hypothetical protein